MLSKKSIRIISVIVLAVMMLMVFASPVLAVPSDIKVDENSALSNTGAGDIASTVLGAIKWIGIAIAIGMLMFLGIKYVTSSPEGKADLKKQLGIYVIGFAFIVGATTIVGVLESTVGKL